MSKQGTKLKFPLHPGAEGADVAQVQAILLELGLFIAPVELREQRFGSTTAEAVSRWKERHGLPTDPGLEREALDRLWTEGRELPRLVHGVVSLADATTGERKEEGQMITLEQIQAFCAAWYKALDIHAPIEQCLRMLTEDDLHMRFPDAEIQDYAAFRRWYVYVTQNSLTSHMRCSTQKLKATPITRPRLEFASIGDPLGGSRQQQRPIALTWK